MRRLPFDYAIRNLGRRPLRTLLTGLACVLVAAVLVATTAFVRGLERSFANAGQSDVAILLSSVAERDVLRSTVSIAVESLIAADIASVKKYDGVPAVSSEIHMGTNLVFEADSAAVVHPAFVRGVTTKAFLVHDAVSIVDGTPPKTDEVLVGALVAQKLGVAPEALAIGSKLRFEGNVFTVSGHFTAPGTTIESEIWTPLHELKSLSRRDDCSAVFVRMESPDSIGDLEVFGKRRLDLEIVAIPSATYYKELAQYFGPVRNLAWVMALLIAGAVVATGANTLNTAVQDRMRELATLRAVGYSGFALSWSLLEEALLLAASGGLLGLIVARVLVTGTAFRIGMGAFALEVDATGILIAFVGVLILGLLGTIPSTIRVLRLPVAAALKES